MDANQPVDEKSPKLNDFHSIEEFNFPNIEQFEAFENPLRFEMVCYLSRKAFTDAQLGQTLCIPRHQVYFHLNLLEKHGLIVKVGERKNGNIMGKYYRATANIYNDDAYVRSLQKEGKNSQEAQKTARALRLLLASQMRSINKIVEQVDTDDESSLPFYNWD